jgi:hypothetical protein
MHPSSSFTHLVEIPNIGQCACFKFDIFHHALFAVNHPLKVYRMSNHDKDKKISSLTRSFGGVDTTSGFTDKQKAKLKQIQIISDVDSLNYCHDNPKKYIYIKNDTEYYTVLIAFDENTHLPKSDIVVKDLEEYNATEKTVFGGNRKYSKTTSSTVMRLLEKRRNRMKWERMFGKQNTTAAQATYTSELMQIDPKNNENQKNQNPFPFLPISPTEFMLDENQLNAYISYTYTELLRAVALTEVDPQRGGYYHEADGLRTAETDKCFAKNEESCDRTTYTVCTDYCNMFHSILASSDSIHDFLGRIPNVSRNDIFNLYEKETNYKKHFSTLFDTCRNIIVRRLTQKLSELSKDEMKFIYLGRLNNIVNVNRKIQDFEYEEIGHKEPEDNIEGAIFDKSKPWESMFMSQFFYTVLPFEDRHKLYKLDFEVMLDKNNPANIEFKEYLKKYNFQYFFLDTIIARKDGLEYYQWNQLKSYLEIEHTIDNGLFSVGEIKSIAKWWDPSSGNPGEKKIFDYIANFSEVLRTEVLQTCNKVQFIKIAETTYEGNENTILSSNTESSFYSPYRIEIKIEDKPYYIKIPNNSFTIENCISMYDNVSSLQFSPEVKDDLKLFILSLKRSGDHGQTMYLKKFNQYPKNEGKKAFLITGDSLCAVKALYEKQPVLFFKYYMDYSTNDQKVDIFLYNSEEKYESKTCYNYIILNKLEDYIDSFDSIKDNLNTINFTPVFDTTYGLRVENQIHSDEKNDVIQKNMNILYNVKLFDDLVKFGDNLLKDPVSMEVENNPPQENAQQVQQRDDEFEFNTNTSIKYFEEDLNLNKILEQVKGVQEINVEGIRAKIKQRIQEENNNRMTKFVRQSKRIKQQAETAAFDQAITQQQQDNFIVVMDILKKINEYLIEGIYHVDNLVLYLNMYFELLEKFENENDRNTIKNIFKDNINTINKVNYTNYFSKLFEILSNDKLKLKKSEPNHGSSKLLAERLVVLSSLIYKCVKPVDAAADDTSINDLKEYNENTPNAMPEFYDLTSLGNLNDYPLLKSISDKTFKTLYNNGPAPQTPQPPQTPPNTNNNTTNNNTINITPKQHNKTPKQLNQFP